MSVSCQTSWGVFRHIFIAHYHLTAHVDGLSAAFFYLLHKRLTKSWGMRAESHIGKWSKSRFSSSDSQEPQQEEKSSQRTMSSQQRKQYIKPAMVLLVLVFAMAVCTLPYGLYLIAVEGFCKMCGHNNTLYFFLLFLNLNTMQPCS